jgi:hypothetical protein
VSEAESLIVTLVTGSLGADPAVPPKAPLYPIKLILSVAFPEIAID